MAVEGGQVSTPAEIAAKVRELDAKATPAPWHKGSNGHEDGDPRNPAFPGVHDASGKPHGEDFVFVSLGTSEECHSNADLCAFYRTAAPALADALERSQAALEVAREALEQIKRYEADHREGICPYGCDTPWIATDALAEIAKLNPATGGKEETI